MREFKFRAWCRATKKMCEITQIDFYNERVGYLFADPIIQSEAVGYLNFSDIELMQYTGLGDKNGTEVYEGDILKWEDEEGRDIISTVWNDEFLRWDGMNADYSCSLYEFSDNRFLEVIGNIYEDEDLVDEYYDARYKLR